MEQSQNRKNELDEFIDACNFNNETDNELLLSNTMFERYKHLFKNNKYKGFNIITVTNDNWWK